MEKSRKSIMMFIVMFASVILLSTAASAQIPPYLYFGGNYQYDVTSKALTFTDNYAEFLEFDNYEYDYGTDSIIGATVSFGTLTNSTSNPLVFSASTFTVDGFFTATLDDFVVNNSVEGEPSQLMWGTLNNIQSLVSGGTSRYVDELLANGGGSGNIGIFFTPDVGDGNGRDPFTATSGGAINGVVAAPEPVSAILFVVGGGTLAFARYRRKRSQQKASSILV